MLPNYFPALSKSWAGIVPLPAQWMSIMLCLALMNCLPVSLLFGQLIFLKSKHQLLVIAAICGANKHIQLFRGCEWHSDTGALGCALKSPALPWRLSGHY